MFYHLFLKTLLCVLLATPSWGATKDLPTTHLLAIATANSVNHWKTVEEYRKSLARYMLASEMAKLNAEFVNYGIKGTDKFPKMTVKENKASFDKNNYLQFDKKGLIVNGKLIKLKKATPAELFVSICEQLACKKQAATASFSWFPKAHAGYGNGNNYNNNGNSLFGNFNWKNAVAGALALGAGAYLFTNNEDPQYRKQTALRAGLVGFGLGGLFFGQEAYNSCGNNCTTRCNGPHYEINNNSDYRYGNSPRRGATRIYANDYGSNDYDPSYREGYQSCNSGNVDYVGCNVGARNCNNGGNYDDDYRGGGGDQLRDDIGGATVSDKNNGEAKRGTTSLPAKKK